MHPWSRTACLLRCFEWEPTVDGSFYSEVREKVIEGILTASRIQGFHFAIGIVPRRLHISSPKLEAPRPKTEKNKVLQFGAVLQLTYAQGLR